MRKLFFMFKSEQNHYVIGRDDFMNICKKHRLTHHLTDKKRYKSVDIKSEKLAGVAENLVPKGLLTLRPNVIWYSDITYLKAGGRHENRRGFECFGQGDYADGKSEKDYSPFEQRLAI